MRQDTGAVCLPFLSSPPPPTLHLPDKQELLDCGSACRVCDYWK